MTLPRKSASEIAGEIITQFQTSFSTTIPLLQKAFLRVLAKTLGGEHVLLYQYANWILLQQFVRTASARNVDVNGVSLNPLQAHGDLVDIHQQTGQRAELTVAISVLTQGGTITSGERIANPDTQMIYVVIGDVSLNASTVHANIRATKSGILGNVDVGTTLSFVSPPDAVQKDVTVSAIVQEGVDPESTESYRLRIRERWMARPQGGSYADYKNWAEEVTGVRHAYIYSGWGTGGSPDWEPNAIPSGTAGQVFVYIEDDVDTDGIPDASLLTEVAEHIEGDGLGLANRRPINTYVKVLPITRTEVDVTISGLTVDLEDFTLVQTAVEDAVTEYFYSRIPGGQAGYTALPPRRDIISQLELGGIVSKVVFGYNGVIGGITVSTGETYYLQEGEKAKLGSLTWN